MAIEGLTKCLQAAVSSGEQGPLTGLFKLLVESNFLRFYETEGLSS